MAGPVKKFPAFCATRKFITSARSRHSFTIRTLPSFFCGIHLNIILPSPAGCSKWLLSCRFSDQIFFFDLYIPLCYDVGIINRPFISTQYLQHVSACTAIIRYYSCKILRGRLSANVRLTVYSVVTLTVDIIVTACGLYIAAVRL